MGLVTGALLHLRRGVYASADACAPVIAAALHGGTIGCATAARHHGLWVIEDSTVHTWIGHDGHVREHQDCQCVTHWSRGRPGRAFEMPSVVETLVQLYRCGGSEPFFAALESALHLRRLRGRDIRRLRERLDETARDLIDFATSDAESGLESIFRLRMRQIAHLICSQVDIFGVGRVDFLIDGRIIVEIDGRLGHTDPAERHKDLMRDGAAASWGFVTLRFSYAMVVHDWDAVERAVLGALDN